MTVVRTDLIPNLYANPISYVVQYNPAYVIIPVEQATISTTGTIGTVTGSGTQQAPWTATISLMTTSAGLTVGDIIAATPDSGDFAAGGEVSVASIVGNQSIQIIKVGGTIPTAGTVTDITLPGQTTLPTFLASGDPILFTNPGNQFTFTVSGNGTFVAGETFNQQSTGATGIITNVIPADDVNYIIGIVDYTATSGVVDTTYNVVGDTSGAYAIPATVTGMNELLTAGENGTNQFYVEIAGDRSQFSLYTDPELTIGVDSTGFTYYTRNAGAGQYTTTDTVLITVPTP